MFKKLTIFIFAAVACLGMASGAFATGMNVGAANDYAVKSAYNVQAVERLKADDDFKSFKADDDFKSFKADDDFKFAGDDVAKLKANVYAHPNFAFKTFAANGNGYGVNKFFTNNHPFQSGFKTHAAKVDDDEEDDDDVMAALKSCGC